MAVSQMCLSQIFVLLTVLSQTQAICDTNWIENGLFCYYISNDTRITLEEADQFCKQYKSRVVAIDDLVENEFLYRTAIKDSKRSVSIGYIQILKRSGSHDAIWRWLATGRTGNFLNWDISEPDGEGDCARMTPYLNGKWRDYNCDEPMDFICKKYSDCGVPPNQTNGVTSISAAPLITENGVISYAQGTVATNECASGYEFKDGTSSIIYTCELGGLWMTKLRDIPVCEPKLCPPPATYDRVLSNASSNAYYDFGTVISYECEPGYWFSRYETGVIKHITCGDDKLWHNEGDEIGNCTKIYCIRPVTNNAIANTSLNLHNTVAHYKCSKGYKFYSDNATERIFTCNDETGWEPAPEQCKIKRCPYHNVSHAIPSVHPDNFIYDALVIWKCEPGRRYPDTSMRKLMYCQENEEWNAVITTGCERKKCIDPPPNTTTTAEHNWNETLSYQFEDLIYYTCINDGWLFPDNRSSRAVRCDEEGRWFPEQIGECIGEAVAVKKNVYHQPTEQKHAEVFGSVGLILVVTVIIFMLVLDLSTLGKHLQLMRYNLLKNPTSDKEIAEIKKQLKEFRDKHKKNHKPKKQTVIYTKSYRGAQLDNIEKERERQKRLVRQASKQKKLNKTGSRHIFLNATPLEPEYRLSILSRQITSVKDDTEQELATIFQEDGDEHEDNEEQVTTFYVENEENEPHDESNKGKTPNKLADGDDELTSQQNI